MHVLIIEDEPTHLMLMRKQCEIFGFTVTEAQNGEEGLLHLKQPDADRFSLVITDLMMPFVDGREVVREARRLHPTLPVIIITSESSEEVADELKTLGAQDFLTKPISKQRLKVSIDNALQVTELKQEVARLHKKESGAFGFDDLIGAYSGLASSVAMARKFARSDMPVLITGESGVGKEVFARAIHGESGRSGKPFIAINCGAIPSNLVESTLFGHEKGAFTGAIDKSLGKFREAQGGTLFLDEVGELPLDTQVKLLRALQQFEVEPVGLGKSVTVDVRIISATNKPLQTSIDKKEFRADLYFRLAVLPLELPPLRRRSQDIPDLCEHFLGRVCAIENLPHKTLSAKAMRWVTEHEWPGNVRELENTLSRAILLADHDIIEREDIEPIAKGLPVPNAIPNHHSSAYQHADGRSKTIDEVILDMVRLRMKEHNDDVNIAAESLGMPPSTLYRKLREWKQSGDI